MPSIIEYVPPWTLRGAKRSFDYLRELLFTKTIDKRGINIESDHNLDTIRQSLGYHYFTNSWELSYNYKGEDLNMRRPLWIDDEYEWYQVHVRAWVRDDGRVSLEVHIDLEPTEYPYLHLNPPDDAFLDEDSAIRTITQIFDTEKIEYEVID